MMMMLKISSIFCICTFASFPFLFFSFYFYLLPFPFLFIPAIFCYLGTSGRALFFCTSQLATRLAGLARCWTRWKGRSGLWRQRGDAARAKQDPGFIGDCVDLEERKGALMLVYVGDDLGSAVLLLAAEPDLLFVRSSRAWSSARRAVLSSVLQLDAQTIADDGQAEWTCAGLDRGADLLNFFAYRSLLTGAGHSSAESDFLEFPGRRRHEPALPARLRPSSAHRSTAGSAASKVPSMALPARNVYGGGHGSWRQFFVVAAARKLVASNSGRFAVEHTLK